MQTFRTKIVQTWLLGQWASFKMLHEKDLPGEDEPELVLAISFRLQALARVGLQGHPQLRGWSMPGHEPGMVFAHRELFEAAAAEPLVEVEGKAVFEPKSFFRRLLELSEEHGHG